MPLSLTLLLALAAPDPTSLVLAEAGASPYVVVLADDAPAPDRTAARELIEHLAAVTGVTLPLVTADAAPADRPQVRLGAAAGELGGLGPDAILLRTAGRHLLLAGTPPRGTLYAVYTFLEDVVGCRWWTSSERFTPTRPRLEIPPLKQAYTPPLRYREVFYRDAFDGTFAPRLKHNGHFVHADAEHGGHLSIVGFCHTFYQFLPPARWFAAHPDWYSERGGKRVADGGQLCCSSPGARAELTKVVLEQLRRNPTAGLVSVSQNDWAGWCECASCRAAVAEDGSQAGPLLRLVNEVAAAVEREFPDVLVETLAYQASRQPPKVTSAARNVVIRLCSIEADFGQPLASGPRNAGFARDIAGWRQRCRQLFIWNYVTNFSNYLLPHANLTPLAGDVRWFVDNGAVGLFEQGDAGSTTGDFVRLRAWLLGHLLWDPRRDAAALTREFLDGYYGPAAPHLQRYLDLREAALRRADVKLGCFRGSCADWCDLDTLTAASGCFDAAARAVADQPVLLARVERERLPLTLAWLLSDRTLRRDAKVRGLAWAGPADPAATAEAWRALALRHNNREYAEGRPFAPFADALVDRFRRGAPPELCRALAPDDWVDWQDGALTLHGLGNWVTRVKDPAASDGQAARMPGSHNQWAVQASLDELAGERWRVHAVVRVDAKATDGPAFDVGVWDGPHHKSLAQRTVPLAELATPGYHTLDLGEFAVTPGLYVWLAPKANPAAVTAVYVDRVFAARAKPQP